jgi:hypothetical protein
MARLFPGSTVLTANVSGVSIVPWIYEDIIAKLDVQHSLYGVDSKCIDTYTRQYFLNATLPPPDTVCEVDRKPFFTPVEGLTPESSITRRWLL